MKVPFPHFVHDNVWSLLALVEYRILGLTIAFLPPRLLVLERTEYFLYRFDFDFDFDFVFDLGYIFIKYIAKKNEIINLQILQNKNKLILYRPNFNFDYLLILQYYGTRTRT